MNCSYFLCFSSQYYNIVTDSLNYRFFSVPVAVTIMTLSLIVWTTAIFSDWSGHHYDITDCVNCSYFLSAYRSQYYNIITDCVNCSYFLSAYRSQYYNIITDCVNCSYFLSAYRSQYYNIITDCVNCSYFLSAYSGHYLQHHHQLCELQLFFLLFSPPRRMDVPIAGWTLWACSKGQAFTVSWPVIG